MLEGPQTSTIYTDHKPLVGFLNSDTHEDIFARWVTRLRMLSKFMDYQARVLENPTWDQDWLQATVVDHIQARPKLFGKQTLRELRSGQIGSRENTTGVGTPRTMTEEVTTEETDDPSGPATEEDQVMQMSTSQGAIDRGSTSRPQFTKEKMYGDICT